jgi:hypothetical protein
MQNIFQRTKATEKTVPLFARQSNEWQLEPFFGAFLRLRNSHQTCCRGIFDENGKGKSPIKLRLGFSGPQKTREQGCQMVYFQTKNPNWDQFLRALDWKMLI